MKITKEKIKRYVSRRILLAIDRYYDQRICGCSLAKYIPSVYRDDENEVGLTGSQSTHYNILKKIFSHVKLTEKDCFLDIGCGMGRVLAFLIREHCPCPIHGIEINEISGKVALEWTKKYDQVQVAIGDAFTVNYDQYTVLFMGRPFLPKTFAEFLRILEPQLTHPVTLIYWVDQQSGQMLLNRPGWTLKYREWIEKVDGLVIYGGMAQGYSIWEYRPGVKVQ